MQAVTKLIMITLIWIHYIYLNRCILGHKQSFMCVGRIRLLLCILNFAHPIFLMSHINIILLSTHTPQCVFFCLVSFSEISRMRYLIHAYYSLVLTYALI